MLPIPGLDPGPSDPSEQAFASGMLAGAGLREVSQVLGLSRKRQGNGGKGGGAMPSSATMLGGSMGDLDRIMLLARLKEAMGAGMGSGPSEPGMAQEMVGPLPGILPMVGPSAPPMGPLTPPVPPGGGLPLAGPGLPPPMPAGLMPPTPMPTPGGALPLQLLMKLLSDAGGVV